HRRHARGRGACAARRTQESCNAGEVPAAPEIRRRRRGNLGQCIAAALGDADRSERSAHALADHHQGGGETIMKKLLFATLAAFLSANATAQQLTLHGAVQFPDDHVFTRTLVRFQELVDKYSGKKTNWVLHKNSELGLEKQYFEYMSQ